MMSECDEALIALVEVEQMVTVTQTVKAASLLVDFDLPDQLLKPFRALNLRLDVRRCVKRLNHQPISSGKRVFEARFPLVLFFGWRLFDRRFRSKRCGAQAYRSGEVQFHRLHDEYLG